MVKNHYHNSHADLIQRLDSSVRSFLSDISPESPCAYCTSTAKEKARHVPRCAVLFQAALLLASLQDGDSTTDGATTTALRGNTVVDNRTRRSQLQTSQNTQVQSAASQEQREGEGRGGVAPQKKPSQHSTAQPTHTNDDIEHLINLLSRLVLRHEEAISVLRQNTGWVMYLQTPKHACSVVTMLVQLSVKWHQETQMDTPVSRIPLRCVLLQGLIQELLNRINRQDVLDAAKTAGWVTEEGWVFQVWCPQNKCLKASTTQRPLAHTTVVEKIRSLQLALAEDSSIHRFRSLRPLKEEMQGETVVMILDLAIASDKAKQAQALMQEMMANSIFQIVGLQYRRESLQRSPLARELHQMLTGFMS